MIFTDASYIIALGAENDQWQESAKKISQQIKGDDFLISKLILSETITLVGKIGGVKWAKFLYKYIKQNYKIYQDNLEIYEDAMDIYILYDGILSLADSMSVEIMKRANITKIASFDSDFDKIKGIQRIF